MPPRSLTFALVAAALLPSCAYVQTHKNVREMGQVYQGYQLEKPQEIFRSQGRWYAAAREACFRQHHDPIHDNVFRKSHQPRMEVVNVSPNVAYKELSPYTATVLLRTDGYVESASLAEELQRQKGAWVASLPHASRHTVRAEVAGQGSCAMTHEPSPAEVPLGYRVLSGLDFVFVDVPGTLVYNVAVPFIAPFVFFKEFLNDE